MVSKPFAVDPRYFQVVFQSIFLAYGIVYLGWNADWLHYVLSIGGCLLFNYSAESIKRKEILPVLGRAGWTCWGFSVLISAMSLCLLLKTNHWYVSLLAALLTVVSKYVFRWNRKHLFNPSAFGIVAAIIITKNAWLSPGQWGSNMVIFFFVVTLGAIVVTRVQKLDVTLAFLLTFIGLLFWRQVYTLGWPIDHFIHSISTGSLLLFSFFMISDPRTSPNHRIARIIWAVLIAVVSFYVATYKWKYNTAVWVLVAAAPLVPLLDQIFKAKMFRWNPSHINLSFSFKPKNIVMKAIARKITALVVLIALITHEAAAFCGFYVSKADGTLKNKTSQVILVRDGNRTVVTMYNDFQGNIKDFAMVVPVPVVLQKSDIKVVDQQIFNTLNEYSKPRLVEYYDQNPCQQYFRDEALQGKTPGALSEVVVTGIGIQRKKETVTIEAKYLVGEYDILILSATESAGLKDWLNQNGYKIPANAKEVLEPYIKSNLKFFVVKVNEKQKKKLPGNFLRPIQITFNSPKFMLPIRLGMANADGDQDMLVYAFTKKGRIECTNYRTVSLPTGKKIPLFVLNNFGNFYANVFQHQWKGEGKSVAMLEYAWDVSPKNYVKCDPCVAVAPSVQDLLQAGVWWIDRNAQEYDLQDQEPVSDNVYFTRLHVRYNRRAFPQDLMFQVTPNRENFQARYIITHPAGGDLNCDAGKKYLQELKERRNDEMEMLTYLTGRDFSDWDVVMNDDRNLPIDVSYQRLALSMKHSQKHSGSLYATLGVLALLVAIGYRRNTKPPSVQR